MTCPELGRRQDHTQRRTTVGDEVHNSDRVELHGQHFHGNAPEMLRLLVHFFVLKTVCLIDLRGGQALEVFQKGITQGGVLAPIFRQQLLCPPLNSDDGNGDQRHTDQKHNGGGEVHKTQHEK